MVVFSPSLDKGRKVIKYTNPFQNRTTMKGHSCTRGDFSEVSNSMEQQKKSMNEKTISATKLMSFVERRQIYLNSDNSKIDKRMYLNQNNEDNSPNFNSKEIKSTLRKFNL